MKRKHEQERTALRRELARRVEDLAMLKKPAQWPMWPMLPLKRRSKIIGELPDSGVLLDLRNAIRVYLENIYSLKTSDKTIAETPFKEYTSFDELLDDGWEID